MSHAHRVRPVSLLAILVAAILACLAGTTARAEEDASGQELLDRITALQKSGEIGQLQGAIEEIPAVYQAEGSAPLQPKLRALLGKIAKDKKMASARVTAVRTLGELGDAKHAWKEISGLLPAPKVEEASELDLEVVRVAGKLAQPKASKPLLELVKKGKDAKLAGDAARALGGFGADVKGRVKILEELVSLGRRLRPGTSTDKATSPVALERWGLIGPGITAGLNGLTGREVSDFAGWETLYDENKSKLKSLFPAE